MFKKFLRKWSRSMKLTTWDNWNDSKVYTGNVLSKENEQYRWCKTLLKDMTEIHYSHIPTTGSIPTENKEAKILLYSGHTRIPGLWTQILDPGLWTLNSGRWTLDSGCWRMDNIFFNLFFYSMWHLDNFSHTIALYLHFLKHHHRIETTEFSNGKSDIRSNILH